MASIHSHPSSPHWRAAFRVGGKQMQKSTGIPLVGGSVKDAQRIADDFERAARAAVAGNASRDYYIGILNSILTTAGLDPILDVSLLDQAEKLKSGASVTWNQMVDRYLDESTARESSKVAYRGTLEHFGTVLGKKAEEPLFVLTVDDVNAWYRQMLKTCTSRTANVRLSRVSSVLERAVQLDYMDKNPARAVKRVDNDSTVERLPLTRSDSERLLAYLGANDLREWKTAVLLGLRLGMRLMDAVSRTGREIIPDTAGGFLISFVPAKKKRRGKAVTLPLPTDLHYLAAAGPGALTPTLSKSPVASLSQQFARILQEAGIDPEKVEVNGRQMSRKSFHSLRHSCASDMAERGIPAEVRRLITDHDDPAMHSKYTHLSLEQMRAALG